MQPEILLSFVIGGITIASGLWALVKIGYSVSQTEKKISKELSESLQKQEDSLDQIVRRLDSLEGKHSHRNEISELKIQTLEEKTKIAFERVNERLKDITGYLEKHGFNQK